MIRFWFFIVSVPNRESPHIAGFSFLLEFGLGSKICTGLWNLWIRRDDSCLWESDTAKNNSPNIFVGQTK